MRNLMILFIGILMVSTTGLKAYSGCNPDDTYNRAVSEKDQDSDIYQLYQTKNMWTFLKLNTRNGKIWQVQYDIEGENRFEIYLNFLPLITKEKEVNGRFTLYSTQNMWTFILLDQINGKMWQVQWSTESNNRFIIPIE